MSKIVLDDIKGGFNLDKVNANFKKIQEAMNNNVLYRDNPYGEINVMSNALDMNGWPILNVPNLGGGGEGASDAKDVFFTPTGSISSNNVQSAIIEVASDIPLAAINMPQPNGLFAQLGVSTRYAREDHVHVGGSGGGGEGGGSAVSNGQVYAYQRSITTPLGNPGPVTYAFAVASIVEPSGNALANGWTKTIPAGAAPLYVTVASASSLSEFDQIAANEWSEPVILASNGANGTNGLNVATIYLYQRTVSDAPPALPTANVTWQFTPPLATGMTNGWSQVLPSASGGAYLWVTTATAVSTTSTDIITSSEWATAQKMSQDGSNGSRGPVGADGTRGTINIAVGGYSSWSDAAANLAVANAGFGVPNNRDVVTLYGTGFSQTRYYQSGSWLVLGAYLNGNLLVSGTISANQIAAGTFDGSRILFGNGHTPSSRAFEITSVGTVWIDNLFGGTGWFDNNYYRTTAAVRGVTSSDKAGVEGVVPATNASSGTAAVYGTNFNNGCSGLIAPGLSAKYDFYANGAGTNYGPFTGAHDALVAKAEPTVAGDIMIDVKPVARATLSNTIFHVSKSTTPYQKGAIGIAVGEAHVIDWIPAAFILDRDSEFNPITGPEYAQAQRLYNITAVNALGEGQLNVVGEGGDIAVGDLIVTSSVPGKGMKQEDDILRSYTVAKAREAMTFATPNEVKQIACIYLCG